MGKKELPEGWITTDLESILDKMTNGSNLKQFDDYFVGSYPITRIETIARETINLEKVNYVEAHLEVVQKYKLIKGDILFSHINSDKHLGKTAIFEIDETVIHGINLLLIRTLKNYNPRLLNYLFKFYRLEGKFMSVAQRSVNQSSINQKKLNTFQIPLPPLTEQNRIVEKLDKLFASIEIVKAKLDAIPQLVKNFRQAVLSQAVKGNLTERLRKGKQFKEWCLVDAENVFEYVTSGSRGWAPFYDNVLGKQLFVRMTNMSYESLYLNLNKEKLQFLNLPLDLNEGKRTLLRKGDILISITADIGMISFISHDLPYESYINQHICLARPKESYNSQYIAIYLMSESGLGQLRNLKRGVTKAGLSLGDIRSLKINLPPLSEQQEIIFQVESLFAKADLIEKQYQVLKSQIDNLPQAILAKAFIGGLVAQNPNDEPASELLERIKETQTLSKKITKLTQVVA